MSFSRLSLDSNDDIRHQHYEDVIGRIWALLDGESDWIAAMATVVCELHHSFEYFHWTGFYRTVAPDLLKIGPYQGGHGCLVIPFSKGVCGAAARRAETQLVANVHDFPDHIACSSTTRSEIVVPLTNKNLETFAVLDIDSDDLGAFRQIDKIMLESLCSKLSAKFGSL